MVSRIERFPGLPLIKMVTFTKSSVPSTVNTSEGSKVKLKPILKRDKKMRLSHSPAGDLVGEFLYINIYYIYFLPAVY